MFEQPHMNEESKKMEGINGSENEQELRRTIFELIEGNKGLIDRIEIIGGETFDVKNFPKAEVREKILAALEGKGEDDDRGKINIHWNDGSYSPDVTIETIGDVGEDKENTREDGEMAA